MKNAKNELLTADLSKGIGLGQILANFSHVIIGEVHEAYGDLGKGAKRWAAVRATTREEDKVLERVCNDRNTYKSITPSMAEHKDMVFYFDAKGRPATEVGVICKRDLNFVSSVNWALANHVFKPWVTGTMTEFLTQCDNTSL